MFSCIGIETHSCFLSPRKSPSQYVEKAIDELLEGFDKLLQNDPVEENVQQLLTSTVTKIADASEIGLVHLESCLKAQLQKKSYDKILDYYALIVKLQDKIPSVTSPRSYCLTYKDLFNDFSNMVIGLKDDRENQVTDTIQFYQSTWQELDLLLRDVLLMLAANSKYSQEVIRSCGMGTFDHLQASSYLSKEEFTNTPKAQKLKDLIDRIDRSRDKLIVLLSSNLIKQDDLNASLNEGKKGFAHLDDIKILMQEKAKQNCITIPKPKKKIVSIENILP